MGMIAIGVASKLMGVSSETLRLWDNSGKFICHHKSVGGKRFYTIDQVASYLGVSVDYVASEIT